jgi:hypothetical protein
MCQYSRRINMGNKSGVLVSTTETILFIPGATAVELSAGGHLLVCRGREIVHMFNAALWTNAGKVSAWPAGLTQDKEHHAWSVELPNEEK